jgi:cellulose synthase operon protein YhjQ
MGKGRVAVLDLDPKNLVLWHFGLGVEVTQGVASAVELGRPIPRLGVTTDSNIECFAFGRVSVAQLRHFEETLQQDPLWLKAFLEKMGVDSNCLVLVDTPPGPNVYQRQALAHSDLCVALVLAEPSSAASLIPSRQYLEQCQAQSKTIFVVNQLDQQLPLSTDIARFIRAQLGSQVAPISIAHDEGVREALAVRKTVLQYDPHGQASFNIDRLAQWLVVELNRRKSS